MALVGTLALALLGTVSGTWPPSPGPAPPLPHLKGNVLYHLFERKYTGLANKDAGDFLGDMDFIFMTFQARQTGNPEADMNDNIIEMSEVNATAWGTYEACNAPGCTGHHVCPANRTAYCCTPWGKFGPTPPVVHNKTSLPGCTVPHHHNLTGNPNQIASSGFWFSFPMESEGFTWTQKLLRRINSKCLGDAWRKDAGGCSTCGESLDECVAKCIQAGPNGTTPLLKKTWDRVFSDPKECPDVPLPSASAMIV